MNQEHYNKLREGVEAWNKWRKEHPDIIPDLERANLGGAHLERASFLGADLQNVFVLGVQYKKLGRCRGINLEGCSGSPRFIRDAKDNEFIEEVRINHPINTLP